MKQKLRQLLDELHTELADSDAMDSESREELVELAETIAAVTEQPVNNDDDTGQLEQAVLAFETEHPRIAGILSQIADALSRLGIWARNMWMGIC